jgi:hypothetical protein
MIFFSVMKSVSLSPKGLSDRGKTDQGRRAETDHEIFPDNRRLT